MTNRSLRVVLLLLSLCATVLTAVGSGYCAILSAWLGTVAKREEIKAQAAWRSDLWGLLCLAAILASGYVLYALFRLAERSVTDQLTAEKLEWKLQTANAHPRTDAK